MTASVSVVIVAYNSADDLAALLPLLDDPRLEIVVIDNASPDDSARAVRGHPHCRLVQMGWNAGWTLASNHGAQITSSPVLAFVNPDVRVTADDLLRLSAALDGETAAVAPRFRDLGGTPQSFAFRFPTALGGLFAFLNAGQRIDRIMGSPFIRRRTYEHGAAVPLGVDHVGAACMVVDRLTFERVGPFDERMWLFFSDTDWMMRARRLGLEQRISDEVEVVHEGGGSVQHMPKRQLATAFQRDYVHYARKHFSWSGRLVTVMGVVLLVGALPAAAAIARGRVREAEASLKQARRVLA